MSARVFVGLGSNLADREAHLRGAVAALDRVEGLERGRESSLYDTAPVGPPQPRYLNAVVEVFTKLSPEQLLTTLKGLEQDLGRAPSSARWGPRSIDFDILWWDGLCREGRAPTLPHPELCRRRFALEPWLELEPVLSDADGRAVQAWLTEVGGQDVVRVKPQGWAPVRRQP